MIKLNAKMNAKQVKFCSPKVILSNTQINQNQFRHPNCLFINIANICADRVCDVEIFCKRSKVWNN